MTDYQAGLGDVEGLATLISALRKTAGEERDAVTLIPGRLHTARNAADCIELFIEGERDSFAQSAIGKGLEAGYYTERQSGRVFPAVVVRSGPGVVWARPMAHLIYEGLQVLRVNPEATNEELLGAIAPYLALVVERSILPIEHQLGLTGELIFLLELINGASALGLSSRRAIDRWTGWDSASRDFKGGAIAVEVKTTAGVTRQHWVHPMYQFLSEEQSDERVFVYSVGLRVDRSRDYKLTTAVERVLESLPTDLHGLFQERIEQYLGTGFSFAQWREYTLEPGFLVSLAPSLYRVDHLIEILRPQSFVGGSPPARALDLRYLATLDGLQPVNQTDREAIVAELLDGG
jgi:hypothetical protein